MKRFCRLPVLFLIILMAMTTLLFSSTISRADIPQLTSTQESNQNSNCPNCGGIPEFAYLKEDGSHWLVCHSCGNEWLFQRLKCAYCGNENQNTLGYFFADDESAFFCRFYVCEKCRKYIKTIDLRLAGSKVLTKPQSVAVKEIEQKVQRLGYKPGF